jgi:hypothetical protein
VGFFSALGSLAGSFKAEINAGISMLGSIF